MKTAHMITFLLVATSLRVFAQMPQGPPPDPVSMALDKNHDQKLSASEIKGATKSLLKLDKDKDNSLSEEELRPEPPKGRRKKSKHNGEMPPQQPSTLMNALDMDSSGDLSKEEIAAASESLAKLDEDDDGKLSSEEANLTAPTGGGQGEGPPGGGGPNGGGGPPPPPPGRGR
jgi:hypothetical protein